MLGDSSDNKLSPAANDATTGSDNTFSGKNNIVCNKEGVDANDEDSLKKGILDKLKAKGPELAKNVLNSLNEDLSSSDGLSSSKTKDSKNDTSSNDYQVEQFRKSLQECFDQMFGGSKDGEAETDDQKNTKSGKMEENSEKAGKKVGAEAGAAAGSAYGPIGEKIGRDLGEKLGGKAAGKFGKQLDDNGISPDKFSSMTSGSTSKDMDMDMDLTSSTPSLGMSGLGG